MNEPEVIDIDEFFHKHSPRIVVRKYKNGKDLIEYRDPVEILNFIDRDREHASQRTQRGRELTLQSNPIHYTYWDTDENGQNTCVERIIHQYSR